MVDDDRQRGLPDVQQRTSMTLGSASSRLLRRGLDALDTGRTTNLYVHGLISFEEAVFVLSEDWDASRLFGQTDSEEWTNSRQVVVYEFSRSGKFVRKLTMPLIRLTTEGYARINSRSPGRLMVRSEFIHFFEEFMTTEYSRGVRVDYLFARNGQRIAAWTNEFFVDRYRLSSEPLIPSGTALRPEWATDGALVALQPEASSFTPHDESSFVHVVIFQDAAAFADRANHPHVFIHASSNVAYSEVDRGSAIHHHVNFPVESRFVAHKTFTYGWLSSTSDSQAAWFMHSSGFSAETTVWSLSFMENTPRVITYSLPCPFELIRDGIVDVYDEEGQTWNPPVKEDGSARLETLYEDHFHLDYTRIFSCENEVIVALEGDGIRGRDLEEMLVLFRVNNNVLEPIKELDPGLFHFMTLTRRCQVLPEREREDLWDVLVWNPHKQHPASGLLRHHDFSAGYLYSVSCDGDHTGAVVVTNVHTEAISWFYPEVPESALHIA